MWSENGKVWSPEVKKRGVQNFTSLSLMIRLVDKSYNYSVLPKSFTVIQAVLCWLWRQTRPHLSHTRQLSYLKENRAMRPIYGCPENF